MNAVQPKRQFTTARIRVRVNPIARPQQAAREGMVVQAKTQLTSDLLERGYEMTVSYVLWFSEHDGFVYAEGRLLT